MKMGIPHPNPLLVKERGIERVWALLVKEGIKGRY